MQTERTWQLEAVLRLVAGLMMSLAIGMLATVAVQKFAADWSLSQRKFSTFVINNIAFQGAGLVLTHFFLRHHALSWGEFLGLRATGLARAILFGVATSALVLPGTYLLSKICEVLLTLIQGPPEIQPTIQVLKISVSLSQRITFGFTALVLAPVVEEILFRAILYRFLKQLGHPRVAVIGSSLFFGVIHGNLMTLVPLSFLAVVLALLYDQTGNLMAPISAHAFFNAVNFFLFLAE